MNGVVKNLYNYPIKGLSPQRLDHVETLESEGFPFDRNFGFARWDSGFDPANPAPIPKDRFLVLLKEERLAGLQTSFDPVTRRLSMLIQGRSAFEDDLSTQEGVAAAVSFFSTMFDLPADKRPVFAHAAPHRFTDVSVRSKELMNAISFINLASVRDLEERIGATLDPLRFRANVYFDGWEPFSELKLMGHEFTVGGARMKITRRTRRCAATEVNPVTAKRDIPVPRLIMQNYGHPDMGMYAEVLDGGTIRIGDGIGF
jgi:uncharacterized protein YcbX